MPYHVKMNLASAIGLATMFAGIWMGDIRMLPLVFLPNPYISMRVVSLAIYLIFFVVMVHMVRHTRQQGDLVLADGPRRCFLLTVSAIGVLFFIGGSMLIHVLGVQGTSSGTGWLPPLICLVLVKSVGAPLSVTLVYLFARIQRNSLPRVAASGMIGAFVLEALVSFCSQTGVLDDVTVPAVACALVCISFSCAVVGLRTTASPDAALQPDRPERLLLRSLGQVVNRDFIMEAIVAAMLLGYLRGSVDAGQPYTTPVVGIVLAVLLALTWKVKAWGVRELFNTAIVCAAAGILLAPILDLVGPDLGESLCGIGTALFEIVLWILVVKCTRNCMWMLLAAAASRLVVVTGHLLGSLLALMATGLAQAGVLSLESSSLALVFIYIVMLLFLSRRGDVQLAFLPFSYEGGSPASPQPSLDAENPGGIDRQAASVTKRQAMQVGDMSVEVAYWERPCDYLTRAYGLTARESDVLEQLARGHSLGAMEETFVLSRNTIKMHIRHIYDKLDVHSKQEVIDMVDRTRANLNAGVT